MSFKAPEGLGEESRPISGASFVIASRARRPRRPPTIGGDRDARDVPVVSTLAPRTTATTRRTSTTTLASDYESFDFGRSRAVPTRAMGDRSAHVAMEWVCKCADVVMESREAERARGGGRGAMKANRWFNARAEAPRDDARRDGRGRGREGRGGWVVRSGR